MNRYSNVHDAYLGTLADVLENPECTSAPRGQKVLEKFNYQFTIDNPKVEPIKTKDEERNVVIEDYSQKEFDLYESGSNRAEDFAKASKFWLKLANSDGTVNSAYGFLVFKNKSHGCAFEQEQYEDPDFSKPVEDAFGIKQSLGKVFRTRPKMRTPWEWAKESLVSDRDTRQAIIRFSLPEHQYVGNKDQTCTLHGIFMIRNNQLNLTINMRSNDLMLGLVYDLPWFVSLIHKMRDELKEVYPDLQIGSYTHYVHNIHIYERDIERIKKMLGNG